MFLNVCKQTFHIYHIYHFAHVSKSKRCFNVKSPIYYFHIKANTIPDFQICISVPLRKILKTTNLPPFTIRLINHIYNITFVERQTDIMFGKVFVLFGIVVKMTSEIYLQYVKRYLSWWIRLHLLLNQQWKIPNFFLNKCTREDFYRSKVCAEYIQS